GAFLCRRRGRHRIWVSAWSSDVCSADLYEELGSTDGPEIKDRNYFHSIYCRCPGGILVECAATAAGGFARDEPADQLGFSLLLRSEEHTSELQSLTNLVCRLLLEKKKHT